jgi:hypothetical protein
MAPTAPSRAVRTNGELLASARGATIFCFVLAIAFLGGVLYQRSVAGADPVDVTPQGLSDRKATPDGTVVRVRAVARLDTVTDTTRGNRMLALADVPDVIVFGSEEPEVSAAVPAARTLIGELQNGTDKDVDGVIEKFAKSELHVDRSQVRVLNVRLDAGKRGASIRSIVFIVLTSIFAVFGLLGLVRMRTLRKRMAA